MMILAIDYGRKRIGLAICGPLKIANPMGIITRKGEEQDLREINDVIERYEIGQIIVGLPKNMDNTHGEMAQETTQFATMLENNFGLPVKLWDERLSSWQAEGILQQAGVSRAKKKQLKDAIAAALILQSYVDNL